MRSLSLIFSIIAIGTLSLSASEKGFKWPNGAGTGVCLTYDDSLPSQIDIAFPQLEAAGLKGTFFLQGEAVSMTERVDDWKKIAAAGHELANHSLFHPCRKGMPGRDWVKESHDLDIYNIERLESELRMTNTLLHAIDGRTTRTFAYPCGDTAVENGAHSFLGVSQKLFVASRGVSSHLDSIKELNFQNTPAFDPSGKDIADSIAYLEDCYAKGTPAIFLNHGVGGDYLVTDAQLHQEILDYLVENKDRFWVDTFQNVMGHAKSEFDRLGWSR